MSVSVKDDPFQAAQNEAKPTGCPIASLDKQLREDGREGDADAMKMAMGRPWRDMYSTAIDRVLKEWGFPVSAEAIRKHRRNACACGDGS